PPPAPAGGGAGGSVTEPLSGCDGASPQGLATGPARLPPSGALSLTAGAVSLGGSGAHDIAAPYRDGRGAPRQPGGTGGPDLGPGGDDVRLRLIDGVAVVVLHVALRVVDGVGDAGGMDAPVGSGGSGASCHRQQRAQRDADTARTCAHEELLRGRIG